MFIDYSIIIKKKKCTNPYGPDKLYQRRQFQFSSTLVTFPDQLGHKFDHPSPDQDSVVRMFNLCTTQLKY